MLTLTGAHEVRATFAGLGCELPGVDLSRKDLTREDIEVLKQASDDAGGIVVFTNQKPEMSIRLGFF